jgi:hypothetical protein
MLRLATFALVLVLAGPGLVAAQPSAQPNAPAGGSPDFLFGAPKGFIGVRGSWMFARAGSDLFDFVQQHLTVEKKDFNAPVLGFDFGIEVSPRVSIGAGVDISRARTQSEYRAYTDNFQLPINQETSLKERNLFGSVRFNLAPRGQSVSRYAWVPRTFAPYVGAGAGLLWYQFEQNGDFVDFVDLSVFPDYFESSGFAPSFHVFGGTDVKLYRALFLTLEGKYVWANAELGSDFIDFDPIDLAGFKLSTGISLLF